METVKDKHVLMYKLHHQNAHHFIQISNPLHLLIFQNPRNSMPLSEKTSKPSRNYTDALSLCNRNHFLPLPQKDQEKKE